MLYYGYEDRIYFVWDFFISICIGLHSLFHGSIWVMIDLIVSFLAGLVTGAFVVFLIFFTTLQGCSHNKACQAVCISNDTRMVSDDPCICEDGTIYSEGWNSVQILGANR